MRPSRNTFDRTTVPRQRLTHFVCAQNLKNVSIFGVPIFDCIFPTFLGPKIIIFRFREPLRKNILKKFWASTWLFKNVNFRPKSGKYSQKLARQGLTRQRLTHFSSFEHTQNVSIFGEGLYTALNCQWKEINECNNIKGKFLIRFLGVRSKIFENL